MSGGGMSSGGYGKGGMGAYQMLDDWTAPPFFVFMKQLLGRISSIFHVTVQVNRRLKLYGKQ